MSEPPPQDRATLASFYGDMERLLLQQLQTNPKDQNLRLKLLEVYYETHRKSEFLREAHNLAREFDRKNRAAEWNRMVSMGRMLKIEDRLFDTHVGDSFEFVQPSKLGPVAGSSGHERIGESHEYQDYFARLAEAWAKVQGDPRFLPELDHELLRSASRPSSMQNAKRLTIAKNGAQIYFKREDQAPRGTPLSIAVIGQTLLAQRLQKNTVVTATITGFRGIVTASVAARLGLKSRVFMDREDMHRHPQPVFQMRLLGAEVIGVSKTRFRGNDVRIAALDHCVENPDKNFLVLGLDGAPPPYPMMTREFLSTIGRESRRQVNAFSKRPPDLLVARGGDALDAIGFFDPFLGDERTRLVCVEPLHDLIEAGKDDAFDPSVGKTDDADKLLASLAHQSMELPSSIREHAILRASGRVQYLPGSVELAKKAIVDLSRLEGLVPPIQSAFVIGWAITQAAAMQPDQVVVMMLTETIEKDLLRINQALGDLA